MATIPELHTLVNTKETQQGTSDRITGAEIRAVDNAIVDELPVRGVILIQDLMELAMHPITECQKVIVPGEGAFAAYQTTDAPDNITTFPSATSGYLWKRVTHTVVREQSHEATNIVTHDPDDDKLKKSVTLKTLTDWVIQNFEPRVPTIEDIAFTKVMGGFLHGTENGSHRRITLDESHNRFYTVGAFDSYKGNPLNCIARFYLDGSADEVFNTNAATIFGSNLVNKSYSGALFCLLQADGKAIVLGYDSLMFPYSIYPYYKMFGRVNQDGTIDEEYLAAIGNGLGQATYYPRSAAIQPDQKLLVTGDFWEFNGIYCPHIVRILPDGSHDAAFQAAMGTGLNQSVYTTLIQPDGKIVMAGDHSALNDIPIPRVFRLNPDGSRDNAFIANVGTALNGTAYWGQIQPDGKIVLAGWFTLFNGVTVGHLVRLNPDGTLDTAFNTAMGTGFNSGLYGMALQADGKILCGGAFTSFNGVPANRFTRLNADGTLDTAFNTALGTGFNSVASAIAVQSDKRILVAGSFTQFQGQARPSGIVRLLPNLPSDEIIPPWS